MTLAIVADYPAANAPTGRRIARPAWRLAAWRTWAAVAIRCVHCDCGRPFGSVVTPDKQRHGQRHHLPLTGHRRE